MRPKRGQCFTGHFLNNATAVLSLWQPLCQITGPCMHFGLTWMIVEFTILDHCRMLDTVNNEYMFGILDVNPNVLIWYSPLSILSFLDSFIFILSGKISDILKLFETHVGNFWWSQNQMNPQNAACSLWLRLFFIWMLNLLCNHREVIKCLSGCCSFAMICQDVE